MEWKRQEGGAWYAGRERREVEVGSLGTVEERTVWGGIEVWRETGTA